MKKLLLGAVMIAAMMGVMMSSCKKEESAQMKDGVAQTEQSMSPTEQKVLDFLSDYDAMKRGAKVDGESVTPELLRHLCETTVNYCHGFTQSYLTDVRNDTVYIPMPKVDGQGNIAYQDLLETYGNIVDVVRKAYKAIDLENKTLQFVTMSINGKGRDEDGENLVIVLRTGSDSEGTETPDPGPWYWIPFHYGECYVWGNFGPFSSTNTAVWWLQYWLNRYDLFHMLMYNPCPNCVTFIEDPYIFDTYIGNGETDSIFFVTGIPYNEAVSYQICWQDLNRYHAYNVQLGHYEGMPTNLYNQDWYYKTEIRAGHRGGEEDPCVSIYHIVDIWHAVRRWRVDNSGTYPTPIDNEL